jgi:purine-cytosine permease-like protein
MKNKIAAVIVALLVIAFPFRRAFLSDEQPGIMMMFSFVITLAGIMIFTYLISHRSKSH